MDGSLSWLRLPFHTRFHWFAAHLPFSAAVSIPKYVADGNTFLTETANDQLSKGFVVCQERRFATQTRLGAARLWLL